MYIDTFTRFRIFNQLPASKQVMALSATFPPKLEALVKQYMKNPFHVRPDKDNQARRWLLHPLRLYRGFTS